MNEQNFSPNDSLKLIDDMINQAKNRVTENGFLFLLWGWVIFFNALLTFISIKFNLFKTPGLIWISCIFTTIYQVYYLIRKKKSEKVKTYSDSMIDHIWICFGFAMFTLSVIATKNNLWENINPIVILLYGIPTYLSGRVMQFKPLVIGGISCWLLAIIASFLQPLYYLIVLDVAVAVAWIIPGYILRNKYNLQNKLNIHNV
ncbi:MAG: hypothetical protein ABL929_08340 [Ferruginibacter sp.]|nr:hypothetical protein [Ferruginibacter sp.]